MPQLKNSRLEIRQAAEAIQRVLAAERLQSGVDYVFSGSFSEDGNYEIKITLKAPKYGKED